MPLIADLTRRMPPTLKSIVADPARASLAVQVIMRRKVPTAVGRTPEPPKRTNPPPDALLSNVDKPEPEM
jgi:hypothetical protein